MNNEIILGKWKINPEDALSINMYGNVIMEFRDSGELIYTVYNGQTEQRIFMTFRIKGNLIITNQPSSPGPEETEFNLLSPNDLELKFGGISSRYKRVFL